MSKVCNLVHIDGDVIVYRAGFAAEVGYHRPVLFDCDMVDILKVGDLFANKSQAKAWAKDNYSGYGEAVWDTFYDPAPEPVQNCLHSVKLIIGEIINALELEFDDAVIHLSTPGLTFRHGIATIRPYKGTRDRSHQPYHKQSILDYLCDYYNVRWSNPGLEADDQMGMMHGPGSCIATIDKDLDMIPGWHYNFVKKVMYHVDEEEAMRSFFTQMIVGDSSDNIQGCPGAGPLKAVALFDKQYDFQHFWDLVVLAYIQAKPNKEKDDEQIKTEITETARLLWILRSVGDEPPIPDRIKPIRLEDTAAVRETRDQLREEQLNAAGFGGRNVPGADWGGVEGQEVQGKMGGHRT